MEIGLGVPREPVHLVAQDKEIRCVGTVDSKLDITGQLIACAEQQRPWHKNISGYIFKKNSPSCGPEEVLVVEHRKAPLCDKTTRSGIGIYAARLMHNFPHLPVADEQQLSDQKFLVNFVQRIFIYSRWQKLLANNLRWETLLAFHQRHKALLISRDQKMADELNSLLVEPTRPGLDFLQKIYMAKLSAILKIVPTSDIPIDLDAA